MVGYFAQPLYRERGLVGPVSSWYADFVDSPRKALPPLMNEWEVGWWYVGGRRREGRRNWGWYIKF